MDRATAFFTNLDTYLQPLSPGTQGAGPEHRSDCCLIIALASNRLQPDGIPPTSLTGWLSDLARTLGPVDSANADGRNALSNKIRSASAIYLFDPVFRSRLRDINWTRPNNHVQIVDGALLALNMLRPSLKRMKEVFPPIRSSEVSEAGFSRWELLLASAAWDAYSDILDSFDRTEAIFFTANSTLTELLRAHRIQSTTSEQVYEVMHGVGSIHSERFFRGVIGTSDPDEARDDHLFIPQVPDLPLHGIHRARFVEDGVSIAINAYLNEYLMKIKRSKRPIVSVLEHRWALNRPGFDDPSPPILALFGGNAVFEESAEAFTTKTENLILSHVCRLLDERGISCRILYVPHPTNRGKEFSRPPAVEDRFATLSDSVMAWLTSDACIALFSSTLFESRYFGIPAFTPQVHSDRYFPEHYLDLISNPSGTGREDLDQSLERFLDQSIADRARSPASKAKERLERVAWL
jgi:hypothetical protein